MTIIRADTHTFTGGTGKWEGLSGQILAPVWAEPEDRDQVMPAPGPIRFYGFIEGDGDLQIPKLEAESTAVSGLAPKRASAHSYEAPPRASGYE